MHYQLFQLQTCAAFISSLIHQLGRLILRCDKLCIVLVCCLENKQRITPQQLVEKKKKKKQQLQNAVNITEHPSNHGNSLWRAFHLLARQTETVKCFPKRAIFRFWWLRQRIQYCILSTCLILFFFFFFLFLFGGGRDGGGRPSMHRETLLTSWQFERGANKKRRDSSVRTFSRSPHSVRFWSLQRRNIFNSLDSRVNLKEQQLPYRLLPFRIRRLHWDRPTGTRDGL